MKRLILLLTGLASTASLQAAVLISYWDMDATAVASKFTANQGTQAGDVTMTAEPAGFLSRLGNDTGTTLNVLSPVGDPNQALEFYTLAGINTDGQLVMSDFDFSTFDEVTVSLAIRTDAIIQWNTRLHLDYRIDDGSWVDWAENETTNAGAYELESIVLPSAVAFEDNVDLRLRTSSWFTLGGRADFDNIQVTGVPEPSNWGLAAGMMAMLVLLQRRIRG